MIRNIVLVMVLVQVIQVVLSVPESPAAVVASRSSEPGCNMFGFMSCSEKMHWKEIEDTDTTERCQNYCYTMYGNKCKFFSYRPTERTCRIYTIPLDDFMKTCDIKAGPKSPSRDECKKSKDPCSGFLHESCSLSGSNIDQENHQGVSDENACQTICQNDDNCKYYIYWPKTQRCTTNSVDLLGGCEGLFGEKTADMEAGCPKLFELP